MSYYDNQQWPATAQPSWEQQTPPARSGASSAVPREDSTAFNTQLEEVDRAVDNLVKSGKMFAMSGRRDSVPMTAAARTFPDQFDPRMGGPPRHHSVSDFGGNDARSFSGSNLQSFYANQRHQPSRGANEAEQVMQAKRRMAAQRERELRNYHQEQQYNRSAVADVAGFGAKPDRTMSPGSGMSEEERRELIARQRSALYGEAPAFSENGGFDENGTPRPATQGSGSQSATGNRGHSPLAFDHYNAQGTQAENSSGQKAVPDAQSASSQAPAQQRSRANSNSSPSSNPTSSFSLFESAAQQSSRTSTSSPGGSPPRQGKAPTSSGVAPIGTRPSQAQNPSLNKRSTTPLPSPLSYGFAAGDSEKPMEKNDRTTSAGSNQNGPNGQQGQQDHGLGWGSKGGVWGGKPLGVQASVWG
ncbi:hypothetical protein BJ875DRAFT_480880 [Amylocarpus encephaloides]|uniref:Uncharacterized protein n=1 Tax=Amylocarpus encephaloides TaxID=45428 RepID=A0A9P7YQM6_9HELO|nr:hypothetical protein BJ875DRAFT_480880 [Amylocarpus encephaloides]